ncbi:MAG: enoyl-CoA hydratase/isomerase family protein [Planctomycetota bacterium]|jgi:cyclohexa-1,5-dienecarbonyl-CoA hydratase
MTESGIAQGPVRVAHEDGGSIWRVTLDAGKGNILDAAMVEGLDGVFQRAREEAEVKAILIEGAGEHFSFGASVQEHFPDQVCGMLRRFHGLFRTMLDASVFTMAAVRGRCLGGGLELASFCHRVVSGPEAKLGQPEIALGVYAPVASAFLHERTGRGAAEDLCVSGRTIGAAEALAIGLIDEISEDPAEAALSYAREHLLPKSARSLRFAVKATRLGLRRRFLEDLAATEALYLEELMQTEDALEGLNAFIEKRAPVWRNL